MTSRRDERPYPGCRCRRAWSPRVLSPTCACRGTSRLRALIVPRLLAAAAAADVIGQVVAPSTSHRADRRRQRTTSTTPPRPRPRPRPAPRRPSTSTTSTIDDDHDHDHDDHHGRTAAEPGAARHQRRIRCVGRRQRRGEHDRDPRRTRGARPRIRHDHRRCRGRHRLADGRGEREQVAHRHAHRTSARNRPDRRGRTRPLGDSWGSSPTRAGTM